MARFFTRSVLLIAISIVIVCGIFPAAVWVVGRLLFPFQANGSLLTGPDGKVVGSTLIGQSFDEPRYFWGRLSATTDANSKPLAYNAGASAGCDACGTLDVADDGGGAGERSGYGGDGVAVRPGDRPVAPARPQGRPSRLRPAGGEDLPRRAPGRGAAAAERPARGARRQPRRSRCGPGRYRHWYRPAGERGPRCSACRSAEAAVSSREA